MAKIKILDSSIYNHISAGEVVERPASVVKELIENSIDAGASDINIFIKNGGISYISISDNGCGIASDDLKPALLPHSTSKISSIADLDGIATLGFRGEALASVSAVSKVLLKSRTVDDLHGYEIAIEGGVFLGDIKACACSLGTIIIISDLFFNTPARAKFLKKAKQEEAEVTAIIEQAILANPNIAFKYQVDDKTVLQSYGEGLYGSLQTVYKNQISSKLLTVKAERHNISVSGFASPPDLTKSNRNFQTIIVNGRFIKSTTISTAVMQAYGNSLMRRAFPIFVLNIVLPFSDLDVNVHPNKTEVRFLNPQNVFSAVYHAIITTLSSNQNLFSLSNETLANEIRKSESKQVNTDYEKSIKENTSFINNTTNISALFVNDSKKQFETGNSAFDKLDFGVDFASLYNTNSKTSQKTYNNETSQLKDYDIKNIAPSESFLGENSLLNLTQLSSIKTQSTSDYRESLPQQNMFNNADFKVKHKVVGQIFDAFLLIECEDNVYIFDQHACHERILYDKLILDLSLNLVSTQALLIPYSLEIDRKDYDFINACVGDLRKFGFDISEQEGMSFLITAVPAVLVGINLDKYFAALLSNKVGDNISVENGLLDDLAKTACKAAIKAGDKLSESEIQFFITQFSKDKLPIQCPHGRPAIVSVSRKDIDKMFKRIV